MIALVIALVIVLGIHGRFLTVVGEELLRQPEHQRTQQDQGEQIRQRHQGIQRVRKQPDETQIQRRADRHRDAPENPEWND